MDGETHEDTTTSHLPQCTISTHTDFYFLSPNDVLIYCFLIISSMQLSQRWPCGLLSMEDHGYPSWYKHLSILNSRASLWNFRFQRKEPDSNCHLLLSDMCHFILFQSSCLCFPTPGYTYCWHLFFSGTSSGIIRMVLNLIFLINCWGSIRKGNLPSYFSSNF